MGQRRLANIKGDDVSRRPNSRPNNTKNSILNNVTTRKGEVIRAQRRTNEDVNLRASQHVIDIPVNKSTYNGYEGKQYSLAEQKNIRKDNFPKLRIIPLGGLGEMGIGKNMTAFEYDNDIIVIDMGLLFPGNDYPGVNYIIPDTTWLEENKSKVRGHIFTHAHLDHIGAFRHIISKVPAPVYAGKFTIGMLQKSMEESPDGFQPEYIEMSAENHDRVQLGDSFSVELVRVNHSIPDAAAVVIRTPAGVVVNMGDWRMEDKPVDGRIFDIDRLTEIATKEGITVLLNESTNCESEKTHSYNEFDVQHSIGQVMEKYQNSRLIISCFSSQIHRMQLILDEAKIHGRKVAFAGYSMIQNLEVALRSNVIRMPKDVVVKMEEIIRLPDEKICIVCTGSQGEFNAVLNRMASGAHKFIKIKNSDAIVFCSNPIPGNEPYVVRTIDNLMREGSEVIQNGKTLLTGIGPLHLSGHAYYNDHVKLINALNPKYYMPIHGEFHMLVHNAEIAEREAGIKKENIFVCDSGDILEVSAQGARKNGRIQVGGIMLDDNDTVVSEVVLKDRMHMASEGIFVVILTLQKGTGRLLTSPDIISRGFIYLRDSEELMGVIRQYLRQKVSHDSIGKRVDLDVFKKEIKDDITYILYDQTHRMPIVIPVVNEVGGDKNVMRQTIGDHDNNNIKNRELDKIIENRKLSNNKEEPSSKEDARSY
jgi:ribonuclease J